MYNYQIGSIGTYNLVYILCKCQNMILQYFTDDKMIKWNAVLMQSIFSQILIIDIP